MTPRGLNGQQAAILRWCFFSLFIAGLAAVIYLAACYRETILNLEIIRFILRGLPQ